MNLLRKALILLAGVAAIVLVISLAVPRAVHAITATLIKDVDSPAFQPFAEECTSGAFDTSGRTSCSLGAVPAGKRWVIETVSGTLQLTPGLKPTSIDLQLCAAGSATDNFFPAAFQGSGVVFGGDFFAVNQKVWLYADTTGGCGGAPFFNLTLTNGTSGGGSAVLIVSGYLVNVT